MAKKRGVDYTTNGFKRNAWSTAYAHEPMHNYATAAMVCRETIQPNYLTS